MKFTLNSISIKTFLIKIFLIVFIFPSYSQAIIKGKIVEQSKLKDNLSIGIKNVEVQLSGYEDKYYSNYNGEFEIILPNCYNNGNKLSLYHPRYSFKILELPEISSDTVLNTTKLESSNLLDFLDENSNKKYENIKGKIENYKFPNGYIQLTSIDGKYSIEEDGSFQFNILQDFYNKFADSIFVKITVPNYENEIIKIPKQKEITISKLRFNRVNHKFYETEISNLLINIDSIAKIDKIKNDTIQLKYLSLKNSIDGLHFEIEDIKNNILDSINNLVKKQKTSFTKLKSEISENRTFVLNNGLKLEQEIKLLKDSLNAFKFINKNKKKSIYLSIFPMRSETYENNIFNNKIFFEFGLGYWVGNNNRHYITASTYSKPNLNLLAVYLFTFPTQIKGLYWQVGTGAYFEDNDKKNMAIRIPIVYDVFTSNNKKRTFSLCVEYLKMLEIDGFIEIKKSYDYIGFKTTLNFNKIK
ncbi:MAG: hypothetical protein HN778_07925 [Prolixibacteraceae bacterium]|jgi:hypothetical protein|nr:hypothetical protein [Prolixibacteraceae bacterium]MBT6004987.1 hypothetical protein [Prolixibacteraceae bacterium]MBT6766292.1 hypothetical protein [Prolixibacteraceae bacterium]MBT6998030.1 hypothetical protein [Prolixibacteraceae bacterium]MBT7394746.1 hypothetical protein [Prolixibacteraceae bacterium]